ncbi:MAG: serine/threonine protein kinase [Candidatus Hydrogenedentota bacterium]
MYMNRRQFLESSTLVPLLIATGCATLDSNTSNIPLSQKRFFYASQGKTAMMNADGSGLRYLTFDRLNQVTWHPGAFFPDGHRMLVYSMEARRDGPGKPFDEYYHTTPTHIWIHDLDAGSLEEIATRERLAPYITPQLLLPDGRMMIQVVQNKVPQSFIINLDGSGPRPFTQPGEGMPYGMNVSPDGKRVAYHLAASSGYEIRVCDLDGGNKTLITKRQGHVFFGPQWSPDGEWIIFQDCHHWEDQGHDWADMMMSRPDGSELQHLTRGQALWFGSSYGAPGNYGRGSNVPIWSKDGSILFCRRLLDSKVAWEYKKDEKDVDHFNRAYKPELARGGTEICRMNPKTREVIRLTTSHPPVWDFRQTESTDGKHILFCRTLTRETPGLWIMDSDGENQRLLTRGIDDLGVDHPRWIPNQG